MTKITHFKSGNNILSRIHFIWILFLERIYSNFCCFAMSKYFSFPFVYNLKLKCYKDKSRLKLRYKIKK